MGVILDGVGVAASAGALIFCGVMGAKQEIEKETLRRVDGDKSRVSTVSIK